MHMYFQKHGPSKYFEFEQGKINLICVCVGGGEMRENLRITFKKIAKLKSPNSYRGTV